MEWWLSSQKPRALCSDLSSEFLTVERSRAVDKGGSLLSFPRFLGLRDLGDLDEVLLASAGPQRASPSVAPTDQQR